MPTRRPVVVTGAAGNLGSRLVPWLEASGRVVRPVDIVPLEHPRAVVDDLTVPGRREWMRGAAAVVHLAGNGNSRAPWSEVAPPNVQGTRHILDAAREFGVERFVFASSVWAMRGAWESGGLIPAAAARPGDNAYGRSKAEGEALVAGTVGDDMSAVVLRIGGRPAGDARPIHLDAWEDASWLGWTDFLTGVDRALEARIDGVATVYLVSDNPSGRWSLREARDLLGFVPQERFSPAPRASLLRRVGRRIRRSLSRATGR